MKFLRALSGLVLFAAIFLAGGLVIYCGTDTELWKTLTTLAKNERFVTMGAAAVIILVLVIYILSGFTRHSVEQFLSFDSEKGTISISMKAIHDFLSGVGDEFAAILSLQPKLRAIGSALEVEMDVKVKSGTQIPELCGMLQDRVRESIQSNLGISDIRNVKVVVSEIVSEAAVAKPDEHISWEGASKP